MAYPKDKTFKLFDKMEDLAYTLQDHAQACLDDYGEAKYEFNRLEVADDFLTGPTDEGMFLARDFGDGIDAASGTLADVHRELAAFDKALAKLIQVRGQLAEETGIPMFSHLTGGKNWERFDHEYSM